MSHIKTDLLDALLLFQASLNASINSRLPNAQILAQAFEDIMAITGCKDGRLIIANPNERLIVVSSSGQLTASVVDYQQELPLDNLESSIIDDGQQSQLSLVPSEDGWLSTFQPDGDDNHWSAVCVPIQVSDVSIGTLLLLKPGVDQFTSLEMKAVSLCAGAIALAITLTDHREGEKRAEQTAAEAQQYNQELAAILVHDLQVPLGNVITSLEMVEGNLPGVAEPGFADLVEIAVRSSKHLQGMVDSLLDISRLEADQEIGDIEPVSIRHLLSYAAEVTEPDFEQRQVDLIQDIAPNLPKLYVNIAMLQRVLLNLLDNALKVSKANQTITIRVFQDQTKKELHISVFDQGPGIPMEFQERIFEKYQRVEDASTSKGLGLGLAFCRLAVEAHEGRIWVMNRPEGGACFCLTLPYGKPPGSNPAN